MAAGGRRSSRTSSSPARAALVMAEAVAGGATVRVEARTRMVALKAVDWVMVGLAAEAKAEAASGLARLVVEERVMEASAEGPKAAVIQVEVEPVVAQMGASSAVAVARVMEEVALVAAWARAAVAPREVYGSRSPRSPSQNCSAHRLIQARRRRNRHQTRSRVHQCKHWSKRQEEAEKRGESRVAMVAASPAASALGTSVVECQATVTPAARASVAMGRAVKARAVPTAREVAPAVAAPAAHVMAEMQAVARLAVSSMVAVAPLAVEMASAGQVAATVGAALVRVALAEAGKVAEAEGLAVAGTEEGLAVAAMEREEAEEAGATARVAMVVTVA